MTRRTVARILRRTRASYWSLHQGKTSLAIVAAVTRPANAAAAVAALVELDILLKWAEAG